MSNASQRCPHPQRRALTAIMLVTLLAGPTACTTAASSKLASQVAPVRRVWVVASLGEFSALGPAGNAARRPGGEVGEAMRANFPDTLSRNGLQVSGYLGLAR